MTSLLRAVLAFAFGIALAGCVVYEPVAVPQADPFETSFNAAMGAIQDAGLTLASADRATGVIRGTRGTSEGVVRLTTRADGRVEVAITARDPDNRDPGLSQRLQGAYHRRMGR
jgi:hypothetical protein